MNRFEENFLARAIVATSVGTPDASQRVKHIRAKPISIRVTKAAFLFNGRTPTVGELLTIDGDDGRCLIARGLATAAP